jgi:ferrochelatase
MRYGRPSLGAALRELGQQGCRRIVLLPLYPQYSAATTGSTFDAVARELTGWRWVPELRTVHGYHDDPGYVGALAASIAELWRRDGEPERLLLSFHGMPQRYFDSGDPYPCFCQKTARLVRERLGFPEEKTLVTYQSRFGREEWLKPYTDLTLKALPAQGVKQVDVACPGFAADCLETLEEIDGLNREFFLHAGGERYRHIPCLNDRDDHLEALAALVVRQLGGWDEAPAGADERRSRAERAAALTARLAGQGGGHAPGGPAARP